MPRKKVPKFYAVAKGHTPGIYNTWPECEVQIKGFRGAAFKSFITVAEAEEFIKSGGYRPRQLPAPPAEGSTGGGPPKALPAPAQFQGGHPQTQNAAPKNARPPQPKAAPPPPRPNPGMPGMQFPPYHDAMPQFPPHEQYDDKGMPKQYMGQQNPYAHPDACQYFSQPLALPGPNQGWNNGPTFGQQHQQQQQQQQGPGGPESCPQPNQPGQFGHPCSWNFDRNPGNPLMPNGMDNGMNRPMGGGHIQGSMQNGQLAPQHLPPPVPAPAPIPQSLLEEMYVPDIRDDSRSAKRQKHSSSGLESLIEAASGPPQHRPPQHMMGMDQMNGCPPPQGPPGTSLMSAPESEPSFIYELEFAGTAKGNPGPAGGAAVLRDPFGQEVFCVSEGIGVSTCNFAEYKGLIAGLEVAAAHGIQRLLVRGKSELITRQIRGEWQVRCSRLSAVAKQAKYVISTFKSFQIEHMAPSNTLARKLAKKAVELQEHQRVIAKTQNIFS